MSVARNTKNPGARRCTAGASDSKVSNDDLHIESGGLPQVI